MIFVFVRRANKGSFSLEDFKPSLRVCQHSETHRWQIGRRFGGIGIRALRYLALIIILCHSSEKLGFTRLCLWSFVWLTKKSLVLLHKRDLQLLAGRDHAGAWSSCNFWRGATLRRGMWCHLWLSREKKTTTMKKWSLCKTCMVWKKAAGDKLTLRGEVKKGWTGEFIFLSALHNKHRTRFESINNDPWCISQQKSKVTLLVSASLTWTISIFLLIYSI